MALSLESLNAAALAAFSAAEARASRRSTRTARAPRAMPMHKRMLADLATILTTGEADTARAPLTAAVRLWLEDRRAEGEGFTGRTPAASIESRIYCDARDGRLPPAWCLDKDASPTCLVWSRPLTGDQINADRDADADADQGDAPRL
jgi:hypothetical protein